MAFGTKTNERPGTRAVVRHVRMSAYKAREVLDLIRGKHVVEADEILQLVERDAAIVIRKALASAIANAETNDDQDPDHLYVSACFADEGPTLKRWRPRARGRATRIRKRTCHITVIVSRQSEAEIERRSVQEAVAGGTGRSRRGQAAQAAARRARVARSRQPDEPETHDHDDDDEGVVATPEGQLAAQDADAQLAESDPDSPEAPVTDDEVVEPDEAELTEADIEEDAAVPTPEAQVATQDADAELAEADGDQEGQK